MKPKFKFEDFKLVITRKIHKDLLFKGSKTEYIDIIFLYWNDILINIYKRNILLQPNEDSFIRNGPHALVAKLTKDYNDSFRCTYIRDEYGYSKTIARYKSRKSNDYY